MKTTRRMFMAKWAKYAAALPFVGVAAQTAQRAQPQIQRAAVVVDRGMAARFPNGAYQIITATGQTKWVPIPTTFRSAQAAAAWAEAVAQRITNPQVAEMAWHSVRHWLGQ